MLRCVLAAVGAMFLCVALVAVAHTSTVSGRVANAEGGVIANAEATFAYVATSWHRVDAQMPNVPNMPAAQEGTATAGADGVFTFSGVAAGDYV